MSGSHKGQVVWRIDASVCFMEGQCSSVSSIEVASGFGLSLFLCVSLMLPETQRTLSECSLLVFAVFLQPGNSLSS